MHWCLASRSIFDKSEVILIHGDDELCLTYAEIFNCQIGTFPIQYLGVPVSPSRLHVLDWVSLGEKNKKKLMSWKGSCLSIVGRTTLINSSLTSTFRYHMSMYLLPITVTKNLDKQRRPFFWQGNGLKRKYHLIKWETLCKSKKKGVLGIKRTRKLNLSLLCKWWWKLDTEEDLWQDIVKKNYIKNRPIHSVKRKVDDSPVWSDLLKVK